jgi:uncharacterized protein involved in type VI secretion and phage assembly
MVRNSISDLVAAVVQDLEDPDSFGRVKVGFPMLGDVKSAWARLVSPMAGKERGLFLRPEVGDEVLVGFEAGDLRRPVILGSLWNQQDPPPESGDAAANNIRFIRSRSGHALRFDDTSGGEKIEIVGKDEKRRIVIDCSGSKIRIECDEGDIEITAKGNVAIESQADVSIKASLGKFSASAKEVELSATGNLALKATGQLSIQGAVVKLN